MAKKACTICGKPSVPGLTRSNGKCQYHWNVGAFGKAWADETLSRAIAPERPLSLRDGVTGVTKAGTDADIGAAYREDGEC